MKIAVIGAGFAGIASAKVLTELGHDVTVFEKAPDVGGVWSRTRRYPGLTTQNSKDSYTLSDLRMPKAFPEWLSGEQVQTYLEMYVEKFELAPMIRLSTEVSSAQPAGGGGWDITSTTVTSADGEDETAEHFDHLVVASGVFSEPFSPTYDGVDELEAAGGTILPPSRLHDLESVKGKDVVIVGYGKSACDVAVEVAKEAASTTVVARQLLWKMPRRIKGVLNYKMLLLTRLGEGLFPYQEIHGAEKVLHAGGSKMAGSMVGSVESVTTGQLKLKKLGLLPKGQFTDIARSTVSLATEGFFEGVEAGDIVVERDTEIATFTSKDDKAYAELANGRAVPADVVVTATGFQQELPFFSEEIQDQLTDDNGDYRLYRQILPLGVPDLTFAGYNSSLFAPLSAEMSAVWIGSHLAGGHDLPSAEEMESHVAERVAWMRERTDGHHARGTNVIPFSMHNIDEVLDDVGLDIGSATKAKQWLLPIDPKAYASITPRLARKLAAKG
ncbi:cation diffusion facilitator CzcD-associated flavoprotein CzcO [Nocardioides albertanoniae]|uniref:Cation diffusion facilitator CzcD-associated flavoprotein CzcO n=1 Tax=Nocardioides albertanoniae TaxID=1175486 RepID=A0A543A3C4_9ACTN|nr:NAD(P)/FAD-dependent oxidoreductase [Nocardioides albertanoniae]TQL67064.1 cation diffusion facilitator CzcD-associated flavoprotein CzcO [Nocardioides albertanoniae]